MKTLADIPINDIDFVDRLTAMAPADEKPAKATKSNDKPPKPRSDKSHLPRSDKPQNTDLGPLDVGRYLDHYGVEFNVKENGGKTLYRLEKCLFDDGHTKNEAAIIQGGDGMLTYQCFHNSCQGKQWRDARKIISGEDSLAQFCEGYDPKWSPDPSKKKNNKNFIHWDDNGKPKVKPARLANYLEDKYSPIYFEGKDFGDIFYHYHDNGVWKFMPEASLRKVSRSELGDLATSRNISETIQLLKDQTYMEPEDIENDPMILNVKNGMLDVTTMEQTPHAPHYYSKVQMPVSYNIDAECPLWEKTVLEIFDDEPQKVNVLQQFFGYCLYPKILFPCALFQIGGGGNGKGLVEFILCKILGHENISHISMARMEKDFGPVEIRNKLLNSCGETETGQLDVTNFKKIAAGDEIQAEVKYKNDVKFVPIAKHMISMNAFPGLKEKTKSFFRRIIVLEYNQTFEGQEEDVFLKDKLVAELDGIFLWALDGLQFVLKKEEIWVPDSVHEAKKRFREKTNPVLLFIEEACFQDETVKILPNDLYQVYKAWCDDASLRPLGKQNFYEQVRLNYSNIVKRRDGTKEYFFGINMTGQWS